MSQEQVRDSDIHQTMAALRRYNLELQARNEDLDAFAHMVAHDLQSLLTRIVGFADLLHEQHTFMSAEQLQEYTQVIAQNGRKMSDLIDALLLLARVRQVEVTLRPVDMASIVAEVEQRLADMIDECQAEVIVPAGWPVALGHAAWVEEIWVNYMSNALQYGGRPPRVELGADKAIVEGRIRFWIRDNGPGLTPEDQARLFKPFTQLSRARLGHGLGLAIVRRIVEKLGGQVGVESDGMPGHGCLFSFSLPVVAN